VKEAKEKEKAAAEKAAPDSSSTVSVRPRCRYGAQCKRKNPEHFNDFAHPGDTDWTDAHAYAACPGNTDKPSWMCSCPPCQKPSWNRDAGQYCSKKCQSEHQQAACPPVCTTPSASESTPKHRPCCRYGASCYRKGEEHRSSFAHPGDPDWIESGVVNTAPATGSAGAADA